MRPSETVVWRYRVGRPKAKAEEIIVTFWEWCNLRSKLEYDKFPKLGSFIGFSITAVALAVVIGGTALLIRFLAEVVQFDDNHEAIRNIGLILVAVFGAPFVAWRSAVAQKQADTAEQSLITDQINKAVDGLGAEKTVNRVGRPVTIFTGPFRQRNVFTSEPANFKLDPRSVELSREYSEIFDEDIGDLVKGVSISVKTWEQERTVIEWQNEALLHQSEEKIDERGDWSVFSESQPNIEVRIGSIYALERIAQDSLRDHIQVMEILTAYIRQNSPAATLAPSTGEFEKAIPRADVQAALDVIGRRQPKAIDLEHSKKYRLDLRSVDLSGAYFSRGNFEGAILIGSRFEEAIFESANLRAAMLQGCLLNFANFYEADLSGANLDRAIYNQRQGGFDLFDMAARTAGMSMAASDFSAVSSIDPSASHSPTFATKDTLFGDFITDERAAHENDIRAYCDFALRGKGDIEPEIKERLENAGFLYWSSYSAFDMTTGVLRKKLWDHLGFNKFPYVD